MSTLDLGQPSLAADANAMPHDPKPGLLLVGNHLSRRGRGRTVSEDLAIRLSKRGFPTLTTSTQRMVALRAADMMATSVLTRSRYQLAIIDVFSGRAFRFAEAVSFAVCKLGRPVIFILHGGDLPRFATLFPERVRRLLTRAAAVTSPSQYLASHLSDLGDIQVIPNPIDARRFTMPAAASTEPPRTVVWLRAFHKIYRPWDAVHAVAEVHRTHPQINLIMIGPDKGDGSLARVKGAIRATGAENYVKLAPTAIPHQQVPRELHKGDIFLNTTSVDNAPVSVLEAMASGLPVVSTNAGGLPYLLKNERTALLTEIGAVDQQAAALRRMIDESALFDHLRANGRAMAKANDWDVILPRWTALIEQVVSSSTTRPA